LRRVIRAAEDELRSINRMAAALKGRLPEGAIDGTSPANAAFALRSTNSGNEVAYRSSLKPRVFLQHDSIHVDRPNVGIRCRKPAGQLFDDLLFTQTRLG
jgi:hypothetical protein